jgi:hypothetical protein
MKTTRTPYARLKKVLVLASLSLFSLTAQATSNYPSIGVRMTWTGNGLAAAPAFTFRYSFPKMDVDFGANFQLQGSRFNGCQTNVMWYVSPPTKKVRLGFFTGVRYLAGASLKPDVVAQEKWVQPESKLNFDELQLRCIEGQAGFGVRVHHTQRVNTFYGVGVGMYQTLGECSNYEGMHRELRQAELSLNCGLSYSFR